jgi:5-methyltetrahydrofolate--homocysteine methyltransferase
MTWRLRGAYPKIFDDKDVGEEARKLFNDAQDMLKDIVKNKSLKARGVFGIFPANSIGDDIEVYGVKEKTHEWNCDKHGKHSKLIHVKNESETLALLHMLRSQRQMEEASSPNPSLSDFVAPKENGKTDYIGAFCVTTGIGLDELCKKFEKSSNLCHPKPKAGVCILTCFSRCTLSPESLWISIVVIRAGFSLSEQPKSC